MGVTYGAAAVATILSMATAIAPQGGDPPVPPGQYSNEEEVYFAKEAKKTPPPWIGIVADAAGWRTVDAFGAPVAAPPGMKLSAPPDGLVARMADGTQTTLRMGRPVTCWVAAKRDKPKPDGSEDWAFAPDLKLHDQGGRALVKAEGAPPVVIRMRNVIWPSGNNRPSLVLYVHKPENPDRAESYAWADPGAARIGVNLRWVQASCTIDGLDKPAASSRGGK